MYSRGKGGSGIFTFEEGRRKRRSDKNGGKHTRNKSKRSLLLLYKAIAPRVTGSTNHSRRCDVAAVYIAPNANAKRGSAHNVFDLLLKYKCEDGLRDVSSSFSPRIQVTLATFCLD